MGFRAAISALRMFQDLVRSNFVYRTVVVLRFLGVTDIVPKIFLSIILTLIFSGCVGENQPRLT